MECADAGTYASIVCHYCIDVPKLVCESICASGPDQTPSNCGRRGGPGMGSRGARAGAAAATEATPLPPRINPTNITLDSARTPLE